MILVRSMAAAIDEARTIARRDNLERCFVAGGSAVYAAGLPLADELFVTTVDADVEGDTFFPEFDLGDFDRVDIERVAADERHAFGFSMARYVRRCAAEH